MRLAPPGISCIKAALALYVFLRKPQKATIYNSGLPQDSSLFNEKPRDLLFEAVLRVHGRRPQCSSHQSKSPPSNVDVLNEGR